MPTRATTMSVRVPQRRGEDDVEVVVQEAVAQPVGAHDGDQYEDMLVGVSPAELVDERHDGACDRGVLGCPIPAGIPPELRSEWFPAPAAKTLAETGAPIWALEAFERLRAAKAGRSAASSISSPGGNPARSDSPRRRSAQPGLAHSGPVCRAGAALPSPRGLHDHRGRRAITASAAALTATALPRVPAGQPAGCTGPRARLA